MDDMVDELDKRKGHSVRMCDGRTLFDKLKAEQKKSAETSAYWKDYLKGSLKEMFKLPKIGTRELEIAPIGNLNGAISRNPGGLAKGVRHTSTRGYQRPFGRVSTTTASRGRVSTTSQRPS